MANSANEDYTCLFPAVSFLPSSLLFCNLQAKFHLSSTACLDKFASPDLSRNCTRSNLPSHKQLLVQHTVALVSLCPGWQLVTRRGLRWMMAAAAVVSATPASLYCFMLLLRSLSSSPVTPAAVSLAAYSGTGEKSSREQKLGNDMTQGKWFIFTCSVGEIVGGFSSPSLQSVICWLDTVREELKWKWAAGIHLSPGCHS